MAQEIFFIGALIFLSKSFEAGAKLHYVDPSQEYLLLLHWPSLKNGNFLE